MNFQERLLDLFELFGIRNAMYMRGDLRVLFLLDAIQYLGKLHRNGEEDKRKLGHAIASVFARTCAFADSFVNLPIVDALCEKYPEGKCAYCQKPHCKCDPNKRSAIRLASISEQQKLWTVNQWCHHLDLIYGENNRARGIGFALGRLNEEVGEVIRAQLVDRHDPALTLTDVRRNISREFSDVFAWISTLATLNGIDLDAVLDERYPHVHRRCGMRPCNCGPYYLYCTGDDVHIEYTKAESVVGKS